MNTPQNLLFSKEHEWVKIENGKARIGITDYAQASLGDITFIELPGKGTAYKQFEQCATIESVKAASDVYMPMSGKVIDINEQLNDEPELINQDPYDKGWFAVIELENEEEKNNLLTVEAYKTYLEGLSK